MRLFRFPFRQQRSLKRRSKRLEYELRSHRTLAELLEARAMLSGVTWSVHSTFFGTQDVVSQTRSLRGLALSSDDASLYAGFINGSTSSSIRKVDADPIASPITVGSTDIQAVVGPINQPKGVATDDRGYVYSTMNPFGASTALEFRIYNSGLSSVVGSATSTGASAQLGGVAVQKIGANYYLYLSRNGGTAIVERWNVTNVAAPTLDTSWGNSGKADLKVLSGSNNAFANGLEADESGVLYVSGGVLGSGRGDTVFKLSADGLTLLDSATVNGAMDVALFGGRVYTTQYLANLSAIAVLSGDDLSLIETLNTGFAHTNTSSDSGYSGIDISDTGIIYVADQIYQPQTNPNRTQHDRILISTAIDNAGPIASDVIITPSSIELGDTGTITVTATIDDTTEGGFDIASAEYRIDGGAWLPMTAVDGTFDEVSEAVTASFTLASAGLTTLGPHTVEVRGTDAANQTGDADSGTLTLVDLTGPVTTSVAATPNPVVEDYASPITLTATISDLGGVAGAEYSADGGSNWFPMTAVDGTFDETAEDVTVSFTLAAHSLNSPGSKTLLVRGIDDSSNTGANGSTSLEVTAVIPLSVKLFDFGTATSPVQAGYLAVSPTVLYPGSGGYGWTSSVGAIDRGTLGAVPQDDSLRDLHFSNRSAGAKTFKADVVNGVYWVTVTVGDKLIARDTIQVNAEGGAAELVNLSSAVNQYTQEGFSIAVSDGTLDLEFSDLVAGSVNSDWVVNSIEIRPANAVLNSLALTAPVATLIADGTTISTFSGSGATPNSLVTITSSLGTPVGPVADASSLFKGFQVLSDGSGNFSVTIKAPASAGTALVTAIQTDGAKQGTVNKAFELAPLRRFDFNATSEFLAPSYTGVRIANVYSPALGYGWVSNAGMGEFERNTPAAALSSPLRRDAHFGSGVAGHTFQIAVKTGVQYNVRVYVGDFIIARNDIQVTVEGAAAYVTSGLAIGGFDTRTTTASIGASSDGVLTVHVKRTTGGDWVMNGIDIWEVGYPDPTAAMLQVATPASSAADDVLDPAALGPIVAEAIDRWKASGLTPGQLATLQATQFQILDLGNSRELGNARPGLVQIDDDAAGYGWYIDSTPHDDAEFAIAVSAAEKSATPASPAAGRMDLLTLVMHELGHELGLEDLAVGAGPHELMTGEITPGIRRVPAASESSLLIFPLAETKSASSLVAPTLPSQPLAAAAAVTPVASSVLPASSSLAGVRGSRSTNRPAPIQAPDDLWEQW